MKCSYLPRALTKLYLPSPPVLINSNPMSTSLPSTHALPLPLHPIRQHSKAKQAGREQ